MCYDAIAIICGARIEYSELYLSGKNKEIKRNVMLEKNGSRIVRTATAIGKKIAKLICALSMRVSELCKVSLESEPRHENPVARVQQTTRSK